MEWIEVENNNITSRESGQTSARSFITTTLDEAIKEEKQMTVELSMTEPSGIDAPGASFHGITDGHAIEWQKVSKNVRRLQVRIVKATQEGRWNKVRTLQRLLTHSFSGKALAVRRVTENQGKRTPGVDGETWSTPAKKAQAVGALQQRGYRPRPLRRLYIPKHSGG